LQKPLLEDWEVKYVSIVDAVRRQLRESLSSPSEDPTVIISTRKTTYQLRLSLIEYVESHSKNSVLIHTSYGDEIRKSEGLGNFLKSAPKELVRIHRHHAINLDKVLYIDHEDQMVHLLGHRKGLSIGDMYYKELRERIKGR